jgi:hypothetical protein
MYYPDPSIPFSSLFDTTGLGIGEMLGYALCNGNNGTPNLSGRFIVGAGERKRL